MSLEILHTPKAPAAIGPYSHGTKCGDFIFTSRTSKRPPRLR